MRGFFALLFLSVTTILHVSGQDSTFYYSANVLGALSGSNVPFWLHANQNGVIPNTGSFLNAQVGAYKTYNRNNPRFFQWSAGVEGIASLGKNQNFFLTDLYITGKAGPVELSIGQRKNDIAGLGDTLLTSGFFALSNNTRPYPKIKLSTPNFMNIIPGNDLFAFNFSYSDGVLGTARITYGNTNRVPEIYMHHKALYLRIGGPSHKISLFAGFNHQAMWGGEEKIFSGGLQRGKAYEYVVFGKPWAASRVGNHFGTIDLAAQWNGNKWNVYAYRQSIYEDGSLSNLSSIADGLNGLRLKRVRRSEQKNGFFLNTLLVEYVYTKNQGGDEFDFATGVFGNDNYYNHYVYAQGWSYKGRSLGNPLIGPQDANRSDVPSNNGSFTVNNRISGIHLGSELSWNETTILVKGTITNNFGTYRRGFQPALTQSSVFVKAERPVSIWNRSLLSISLAADFGKLYTSNSAIMIGWRKNGFLRR
jgi:hypothetical protein